MSVCVKKREERKRTREQDNIHSHIHTTAPSLRCPECGSSRLNKDGFRTLATGEKIQRYFCLNLKCGYRFSANPNKECLTNNKRQICALKVKNLANAVETKTIAVRENHLDAPQEVKSQIFELLRYMEKQGYSFSTIRLNRIALKVLCERGANLTDPETVKEVIAKQSWSESRRRNVINAYTLYLKIQGLHWEPPRNKVTRKFPFIPTEQEIDALICGSGKKVSAFLQVLKETAMRCGEAKRLEWTDIDFEKSIITLNEPEKGSNPRLWKVSLKLMAMLNNLPRESTFVFGNGSTVSVKTTFQKSRKRLADKLQNPRLLRISFHTFRHWKATMLYHKTHDPCYVKDFLGHKELRSTEIYINIERRMFEGSSDDFTVRLTDKPEEAKQLLEVGFEWVGVKDSLIFLRKRK